MTERNEIPHADETRARVDREQSCIGERLRNYFAVMLETTATGRVSTYVKDATVDTVSGVVSELKSKGYVAEMLPAKDDGWVVEASLPREDG